jgi:hypothetical protein
MGTDAEHYGPDYRPDRRAVKLLESVLKAMPGSGSRP